MIGSYSGLAKHVHRDASVPARFASALPSAETRRRSADPYTDTTVSVSPVARAFMYASTRSRVR